MRVSGDLMSDKNNHWVVKKKGGVVNLSKHYPAKELKPHWEKYEKTCKNAWIKFHNATKEYYEKYQKEVDKAVEKQDRGYVIV